MHKCLEDQDRLIDPKTQHEIYTFQIAKILLLVGFKMFVSIRPVCRRRMMMDNVIVLSRQVTQVLLFPMWPCIVISVILSTLNTILALAPQRQLLIKRIVVAIKNGDRINILIARILKIHSFPCLTEHRIGECQQILCRMPSLES